MSPTPGWMGVAEPQHQPFPTEHQLVHVAAGNGGVKGVLTPASLPLNPYPEEDQNALVSDDPFQTAEEKYRYPTILQPHSSTWHGFSLHAPCSPPHPPPHPIAPLRLLTRTRLREGALSHHLLGQRRKIRPRVPKLLHGEHFGSFYLKLMGVSGARMLCNPAGLERYASALTILKKGGT